MKALSKWIEVTGHFDHETDGEFVFDCELPEDGQEVLVTLTGGYICRDICRVDASGCHLESGWDWGRRCFQVGADAVGMVGGNGMTNKEAQITINAIKFMLDNAQYSEDVEEALNMAINALTAQPEERTNERAETHSCDLIDREAAVDAIYHHLPSVSRTRARTMLHEVPSAQPEIIRCRNCKFASGDSRICMKFGHSPIGELDFCAWAERRTDEE